LINLLLVRLAERGEFVVLLIQFADLRCSRCFRRVGKGSLLCKFFLSSVLESFEEHRGSMLMIKIDNRLSKLVVDILFFFFHFKECKSREFTESTAIKLISVLLSKKSKRVSLKTSCNKVYHAATISVRDIVPYLRPRVDMHRNEFKAAKEIFRSLGTQYGRYAIKAYDR